MTGSSLPENETFVEQIPSSAPARLTQQNILQQIGSLLSKPGHQVALGLSIGLAATAGYFVSDQTAEAMPLTPSALTLYTPIAEASADKPEVPTHEELKAKDCTSLRRRANDIYMGLACAQDGAEAEVVYSSTLEKGWVYSAISAGGIYKCAYIKAGVLPEMKHRPKIVAKCEDYFEPLVNKRFVYFTDYNCPELRPGMEGCRSGTPPRGLKDSVKDEIILDGNFATDDPSPFNVLGTGKGGFSMPLPNEINSAISYRVQVKLGSEEGKAIVVRDTNDTPTLDWGFTHSSNLSKSQRRGGTPTSSTAVNLP